MDSETTMKFIKRFYETPRAREIYTSLCLQREAAQRENDELYVVDIPDEMGLDKVTSLFLKNEKVFNSALEIDSPPDEQDQEIEFDEPLCNCDEPTMSETLLSECESKVSEIYNSILQDQKQRELLKWSLKIVNDREIIVEGQRSGDPPDISWRTSVICERISTNVVRSKKGTLYFLLGEINENDMIEKSFSEEIVSMFKYGFPPNWRDIFSKIVSDQPEREYKVHNEKKTPAMTKDITNRVSSEKTNAVHGMDDEMTWESDKLRSRTYSNRNTRGKDLSKAKTTSSSSSPKPHIRSRKKKMKHSNTSESNDADEIEVQRSRSGRLICPVLDYWRGQRICTSPCEGEITIIKSNLEEESRLTLVETSKNSSGSLQNPTISSSAPTSGTNSSGTEWVQDSPKADSKSAQKVSLLKASLRAESCSDEATDTDGGERDKTKRFNKTKSENEARPTSTSRNKNQSDKISESKTSAVEQEISKSSSRAKSERITKTAKTGTSQSRSEPNSICKRSTNNMTKIYPQRTTTRVDEARDSDSCIDEQINLNTKRTTEEMKRSHPIKTRIRFNEAKDIHENSVRETNFNEKSGSRTYPTRTTTQLIVNDTEENIVKHAKSTNSSKRLLQQHASETQTQHSKKLKVDTGKLSSKTGTLARKRELRDMLEQQDEGYEDDAFEGTPFRSKKVSRKLQHRVSPVYIDNLVDVADGIHDKDCKTPITPMNRLRPEGPLSTGKSEIDIMTPGLLNIVNRDDVDRYVNQLKRRKLRNMQRKKIESRTPLTKKPSNKSMTGDVEYSFNIQKSTAMDDEENEDYYWSDNE